MQTTPRLRLVLFSFGFKYGPPVDINLLLDVRFLPNPYWVEELRPKTGLLPEVGAYVLESEAGARFLELLLPALRCALEESLAAGKGNVRIAIGCTGGRHRSVAMAEEILQALRQADYPAFLEHRHLELG